MQNVAKQVKCKCKKKQKNTHTKISQNSQKERYWYRLRYFLKITYKGDGRGNKLNIIIKKLKVWNATKKLKNKKAPKYLNKNRKTDISIPFEILHAK